jgi:ABC-2 type transport system ATP-binding protein
MTAESALQEAPTFAPAPTSRPFNLDTFQDEAFSPTSTATPAIATTQLTKRYDSMVAVDRLDLRVEQGEIFGFLGPNGAGKTTTMRMLLGLIRPTSGSAQILGMDVSSDLPAILARTGSMIEEPAFYPYLSGRDNLRAMARLSGVSEDLVPGALERVDLTGAADKRFKAYSMGMKQRLALGAALLTDPEILILDEPANGLDPAGIVEMRDLMKELKREGRTVLISSHVLHEVEQICDRIAIVNRGRIVVQGRVDELLHHNDRVEIRIDHPQEAADVLRAVPWMGHIDCGSDHLLVATPLERTAEINRILADEGLYAAIIKPQEESLEQYFLDVTEGRNS